ncbi:Pro-Pol polyprotein [Portunus trituberculatus]|uniref:Pro-Pol polyprotein n=1 Tax=Portunus trituberculatus TaxID=210409 RepID=A0A5B7JQS5_PORTR|nr:Pro-Pol polyprotein [Portunus trituberculatus]
MSQPYRELPIVSQPLEGIAIDLTDMTNGQDGHRYILTIIDHFFRYVKFYPLKTKHAQGIVAKLSQYISDFDRPLSILYNNALEFTGRELRTWVDLHGVELLYTTLYHPQSNRTLKTVLAQMCKGYPLRWPALLGDCQSHMNLAIHSSTDNHLVPSQEKVKPYVSWSEIIPELEEEQTDEREEEDHGLPTRHRRPPRRLIEEC